MVVEGDHNEQSTNFYGHLCKVWELSYLFEHRVVLFQCEWFNTDTSGKKTFRVDANCTTIDVRSRWYKDDPFVFPSQVQQVFYISDTTDSHGNWKIVQRFQHRGIWDVPEMDLEADDSEETHVLNHAFQQDESNDVVPISVEDPTATPLHRLDLDAEIIPSEVVLQSHGREQVGGSDDEGFICDEEDESVDEESDEEDD